MLENAALFEDCKRRCPLRGLQKTLPSSRTAKDAASQHGVPHGPYRVVVAAFAPALLEMTNEEFVGEGREHEPKSVQIAIALDVLPTEDVGLYNRRQY